ncbi:hypothetical protein ACP70R_002917 [Stipagrostis hirtigluma subsp. patula]
MSSSSSSSPDRGDGGGEVQMSPGWADLPTDVLLAVLHRLDDLADLLTGVGHTCRSWRRAARGEPELWLRIEVRCRRRRRHRWMAEQAVRCSAGRCEAFWGGSDAVDDRLLCFLAQQAPSLKSLRLISCNYITREAFMKAIKKFPMLEELDLTRCRKVSGKEVYEVIGKACPHLRLLRVNPSTPGVVCKGGILQRDNEEALGIATMCQLRSLELSGSQLETARLVAIIDNCPHLEYLDIRRCWFVRMDCVPKAKRAKIKMLRLPHDQNGDSEFRSNWTPRNQRMVEI